MDSHFTIWSVWSWKVVPKIGDESHLRQLQNETHSQAGDQAGQWHHCNTKFAAKASESAIGNKQFQAQIFRKACDGLW